MLLNDNLDLSSISINNFDMFFRILYSIDIYDMSYVPSHTLRSF